MKNTLILTYLFLKNNIMLLKEKYKGDNNVD